MKELILLFQLFLLLKWLLLVHDIISVNIFEILFTLDRHISNIVWTSSQILLLLLL